MRNDIHCLMVMSVQLTPEMTDLLFDAACLMLRGNSRARKFRSPEIEGRITTSFKMLSFGGISGVEFLAEVENEDGKGQVKFVVRPPDVDRRQLEWAFYTSEELEAYFSEQHGTSVH